MVEYKLINARDIALLENLVTEALNHHWTCVGGICIAMVPAEYTFATVTYFQAVQRGSTT